MEYRHISYTKKVVKATILTSILLKTIKITRLVEPTLPMTTASISLIPVKTLLIPSVALQAMMVKLADGKILIKRVFYSQKTFF